MGPHDDDTTVPAQHNIGPLFGENPCPAQHNLGPPVGENPVLGPTWFGPTRRWQSRFFFFSAVTRTRRSGGSRRRRPSRVAPPAISSVPPLPEASSRAIHRMRPAEEVARAAALAGPLGELLPPVDFCCAYGSTLLHARPDASSMVDYILGVPDPLQWHSEVGWLNPYSSTLPDYSIQLVPFLVWYFLMRSWFLDGFLVWLIGAEFGEEPWSLLRMDGSPRPRRCKLPFPTPNSRSFYLVTPVDCSSDCVIDWLLLVPCGSSDYSARG